MRKVTTFILLIFVVLGAFAQSQPNGKPYVHGQGRDSSPIPLELRYGGKTHSYEGVRIGEYIWTNRNISTPKNDMNGDVATTQAQLNTYMGHLELDAASYKPNLDEFTKYYGIHYYLGNFTGDFGPQKLDNAFNIVDVVGLQTGLKVADRQAYQQLFAMCSPTEGLMLTANDIRNELAPLNKANSEAVSKPWLTNPLAFDIGNAPGKPSDRKTYWFERPSNKYGFNMMPSGGRANGTIQESIIGMGSWQVHKAEYLQLFYVAKYAYDDGSVDVHDWIHFYPDNKVNAGEAWDQSVQAYSYGTWYNARFCRKLSAKELGYEIYYIPGTRAEEKGSTTGGWDILPDFKDPKIQKVNTNAAGIAPRPSAEWEILPAGYLRGFYTQYEIYEGNPKGYTLLDYVNMARCVDTEGNEKDNSSKVLNRLAQSEVPCDCKQQELGVNLLDHLAVTEPTNHFLEVSRNQVFEVYARTEQPDNVHIGLFKLAMVAGERQLTFVEKLSIGAPNSSDIYTCKMSNASVPNGNYILHAYISQEGKIGLVERAKDKLHIIDRLPFVLGKNSANTFADMEMLMSLSIIKFPTKNKYAVKYDEDGLTVLFPSEDTPSNISIGLFSEFDGSFIREIATGDPQNSKYTCVVENLFWSDDIYEDEGFILAAYDKNTEEMVTRKDGFPFIDRLPLFIEPDYGTRSLMTIPEEDTSIDLYYNSSTKVVSVTSKDATVTEIVVYHSNSGMQVRQVQNTTQINVSNLASGIYIAKATTDKKITNTLRFMVK